MTLPLSRFLSKPNLYKNRTQTPNKNIHLRQISKINNGCFLLNFDVLSQSEKDKMYTVQIEVLTEDVIHMNTQCRLKCNCPNFKFEFEALLNKFDTLIGPTTFDKLPKKQTGLFACKHVISCINYISYFGSITNIKNKIRRIE